MACGDHGKRIVSITHGATSLGSPIDGGIQETVTWIEDRPATRKSPCISMDTYGLRATGKFRDLITPIVRATSATLTYTLQKMDESGNVTVAIVTTRMGAAAFQFSTAPFDEEYEFMFDAGNSENFAPITVS